MPGTSLAAQSDNMHGAPNAPQTRTAIHALPVELLEVIFLLLSNEPDPCWTDIESATYNAARARAPYRISGVCRYWRSVALGLADLWTYVALPPCRDRDRDRDGWWEAARAALLGHLDRSRSRGLSIIIVSAEAGRRETGDPDDTRGPATQPYWFKDMLCALADEAARWVRFKILFPPGTEAQAFSQLMTDRALPQLRELSLAAASSDFEELNARWLAGAPLLHELCVHNLELHPQTAWLASVRRAAYAIRENHMYDALWSTLRRMPMLQELVLQLDCDVHTPVRPLLLRQLERLTVRGESQSAVEAVVAPYVRAPTLGALRVECTPQRFRQPWGRAYGEAFPDLIHLEIVRAELRCEDAAELGALARVRRVTLEDCVFPLESSVCAHSNFFTRLDEVWPALEVLSVIGLPEREGAQSDRNRPYGDETLQRLAFFIRAKAAQQRQHQQQQLTVSLSAWPTPFPSWFRRVVGMLLGPDRVQLSTVDGAVHSVCPDDEGEDDENDGQFTDSDTSDTSTSDYDGDEDMLGRWRGRTLNGPDWESDSDDDEYVDEDFDSEPLSVLQG
ncbi:hypothetical protein AURDEDRAFT_112045 [Auricularia subglabra TFB-10046 SS5]|nr:hypothetical protein AURDEDRAFT_112045 [Auricularia subglabra TFB-10046 SS5]